MCFHDISTSCMHVLIKVVDIYKFIYCNIIGRRKQSNVLLMCINDTTLSIHCSTMLSLPPLFVHSFIALLIFHLQSTKQQTRTSKYLHKINYHHKRFPFCFKCVISFYANESFYERVSFSHRVRVQIFFD